MTGSGFFGLASLMRRAFALIAATLLVCTSAAAELEGGPPETVSIDHFYWSDLLDAIVFDVGFSDRKPALGHPIITGTRLVRGHNSRYRYEGNRIIFHLMTDEHREAITLYRHSLETLPRRIDFEALNRDERLAYWLNLHNALLIEHLAYQYPVTEIDEAEAMNSSDPLFEAKITRINGVELSLNDIKHRIVYAQWDNPLVLYGFYTGGIGGPTIRRQAFSGPVVWDQLARSAEEFVNSLRGVEAYTDRLEVSEIYGEARALFPDWPDDLTDHLRRYAEPDVQLILDQGHPPRTAISEWSVADLTNGWDGRTMHKLLTNIGLNNYRRMPPQAQDVFDVVVERRARRIENGEFGKVIITDIPTNPDGTLIDPVAKDSAPENPAPDAQAR